MLTAFYPHVEFLQNSFRTCHYLNSSPNPTVTLCRLPSTSHHPSPPKVCMFHLSRLSRLCALLAFALPASALVSPSCSAKWLLRHSRSLASSPKSPLSLSNTAPQPERFVSIVKSLHNGNLPPGAPPTIPSDVVHAALVKHHDVVRSKVTSHPNFRYLDKASVSHSFDRDSHLKESKLAHHDGRKTAPLTTIKGLGGIRRGSLSVSNRAGLTGDLCRSTWDCDEKRVCVNSDALRCRNSQKC